MKLAEWILKHNRSRQELTLLRNLTIGLKGSFVTMRSNQIYSQNLQGA